MATLTVYEVQFGVGGCLHYGVFIKLKDNGDGQLMDVRGSVNAGGNLVYKCGSQQLERFDIANVKGVINEDQINVLENLCRGIPPPNSQYVSGTEETYNPACRCSEWNTRVWSAISDAKILSAQ